MMTYEEYIQSLPNSQKQFVAELIQELSAFRGLPFITQMLTKATNEYELVTTDAFCSLCTGNREMKLISVGVLSKQTIWKFSQDFSELLLSLKMNHRFHHSDSNLIT